MSTLLGVTSIGAAEISFPFVAPSYVVVTSAGHLDHDTSTAPSSLLHVHQPFFAVPSYAIPVIRPHFSTAYHPIQGAYKPYFPAVWSHHEGRYQQPINNLPPLPPIPEGYPPLPQIPPPGGPGAVIITPGAPMQPMPVRPLPPRPMPQPSTPPVVVPIESPTTSRPIIPVTQPRPQPVPVEPPTSRPIIPVTQPPSRPVTQLPSRPIVIPTKPPRPQQPRPIDDDDDVADPISNPPVLTADRGPESVSI